LTFQISGGSGDCDLYVRSGSVPTLDSYGWRPYLNGNNETVSLTNPAAGTYYLGLQAYSAYSGVTLKATYAASGGGGGATAQETEPNGSLSTAQSVASSSTITGRVGSSTDSDYFRIVVPAGRALAAQLTVPADKDYDLRLFNSGGVLLARSENDVGQSEYIQWLNSSSSSKTVFVAIYGYNGAYSTSESYQLKLAW
jgi:hypothetical protein